MTIDPSTLLLTKPNAYHAGKALAEAQEARDLYGSAGIPPQVLLSIRAMAKQGQMSCTVGGQNMPLGVAGRLADELRKLGYQCKTTITPQGAAVMVAWGEDNAAPESAN